MLPLQERLLKLLKEIDEILKKATAIFAKEQ